MALARIPMCSTVSMLGVLVSGSIVGCLATGAVVDIIWGLRGGQSRSLSANALSTSPPHTDRSDSSSNSANKTASANGVGMAMGFACMALAFACGCHDLVIVLMSYASLELGNSLPGYVKRFVPAVITSATLTSVTVSSLGVYRGKTALEALAAYRTAKGSGMLGLFGTAAVGDRLFAGAPAVIVGLGFRLFEQRVLLLQQLGPLLGGCVINCVLSVAWTVISFRLLRVERVLAASLVARFVTLPLGVPVSLSYDVTV